MEITDGNINFLPYMGLVKQGQTDIINFQKGQLIYFEGNTPLGVYIVKEGKVKTTKCGSNGKEQIIRILRAGEIINYSELITGKKFKSTARAMQDSALFFIGKEEFVKYLKLLPSVSRELIIHLSKELLKAEDRIAGLSFKPAKARIAEALINLSDENQQPVNISRKDLACFVGTAKETLNRIISELCKDGLIKVNKSTIEIENRSQLQACSEN